MIAELIMIRILKIFDYLKLLYLVTTEERIFI
jgi:hypothetical protein